MISHEYDVTHNIKYINHITKIIIADSRDDISTIKNIHPHTIFIKISDTKNTLNIPLSYVYVLSDIFC